MGASNIYFHHTENKFQDVQRVFADQNENPEPHGSDWDFTFHEQDGITTVKITIYNESFERMESLMEGFRQGYTLTLEALENLLANLSTRS